MTKFYEFDTTGEAYDASQTWVDTGITLLIRSEGVVGISDTWPFAVTKAYGELHGVNSDLPLEKILGRITKEMATYAVARAIRYGFELEPAFEVLRESAEILNEKLDDAASDWDF